MNQKKQGCCCFQFKEGEGKHQKNNDRSVAVVDPGFRFLIIVYILGEKSFLLYPEMLTDKIIDLEVPVVRVNVVRPVDHKGKEEQKT